MSCPSMTTACQPNACQRRRCASMSWSSSVARLWPSPLTSTIAQSESSLYRWRHRGGFPHRAFSRLAIAHQHVGAIVRADAARVERGADRRAQALAQRSGRHVHERQPRRRMPFEIRGEQPQVGELLARDEARLGPHRVEQRRRVPLRHHQAIGQGMLRVSGVEAHLGEEQRRHQVRRRHAGRRMATARGGRGANGLDAETGGDVSADSGSRDASTDNRKPSRDENRTSKFIKEQRSAAAAVAPL